MHAGSLYNPNRQNCKIARRKFRNIFDLFPVPLTGRAIASNVIGYRAVVIATQLALSNDPVVDPEQAQRVEGNAVEGSEVEGPRQRFFLSTTEGTESTECCGVFATEGTKVGQAGGRGC